MLDELERLLTVSRPPLPLSNDGGNPSDLWGNEGPFIGYIDEPLYAALIVGAVNALPALIRVARAADNSGWHNSEDCEVEGRAPTCALCQALSALK